MLPGKPQRPPNWPITATLLSAGGSLNSPSPKFQCVPERVPSLSKFLFVCYKYAYYICSTMSELGLSLKMIHTLYMRSV